MPYPVNNTKESGTNKLTVNSVQWPPELDDTEEFQLIDCPGLEDTENRD